MAKRPSFVEALDAAQSNSKPEAVAKKVEEAAIPLFVTTDCKCYINQTRYNPGDSFWFTEKPSKLPAWLTAESPAEEVEDVEDVLS